MRIKHCGLVICYPQVLDEFTRRPRSIRVVHGVRIEFENGTTVVADGKCYTGRGTVVFFSFRYKTLTLHYPEKPRLYRSGTPELDLNRKPVWIRGEKTKGLTMAQFEARFGRRISQACKSVMCCGE